MNSRILRLTLLTAALAGLALLVTRQLPDRSEPPSVATASPTTAQAPSRVPTAPPISEPASEATRLTAAERKYTFTLDTATALIGKDARPQPSADGLFDRAIIPAKGETPVQVNVPEFLAGEEVTITAPNGGKLKRHNGELSFTPKTGGPATLDLTFEPTMGRGVYTITIRQAGALATLDFWAGEPNPIGKPGPAYVAIPSTETSSENIP